MGRIIMNRRNRTSGILGLMMAALGALAPSIVLAQAPVAEVGRDPQIGESFRVPYRRTQTNHYLVRCRINGKGPFNFLVDTGAPALFIGTEAAKSAGLAADEKQFWTGVDRFQIEGGIDLRGIRARIEDPFQLEGMNALGLPGARIDGILGFTILARFRMAFDPTDDRLTWVRLDYEPKEPYVPENAAERQAPADVQAMNMLGPAMKLMSVFIGKQPEDVRVGQGVLGIELVEEGGEVRVSAVLAGTPAAEVGMKSGDVIATIGGAKVSTVAKAHEAMEKVRPGDVVEISVKRGGERVTNLMKAVDGF